MSAPPPDDFFPLGPENENPEEPGNFFPLKPEHEIPGTGIPQPGEHPAIGPGGTPAEGSGRYPPPIPGPYIDQWEVRIKITPPSGEPREQKIRIPRDEEDTEEDIRIKAAIAASEIQQIIAERGGDYDVTIDITSIEAV